MVAVSAFALGDTTKVLLAAVANVTTTVPRSLVVAVSDALVCTVAEAGAVKLARKSPAAAFEGAADNRPKPREATATSAMRLKVVFVDICFLSISRSREFPPVGFG
jgi:hypothetical protein